MIFIFIWVTKSILVKLRQKQIATKRKLNENRNCITLEKMAGHQAPDQPLSPEMLNEMKSKLLTLF